MSSQVDVACAYLHPKKSHSGVAADHTATQCVPVIFGVRLAPAYNGAWGANDSPGLVGSRPRAPIERNSRRADVITRARHGGWVMNRKQAFAATALGAAATPMS